MDMNNMASRFATQYGGALPITPPMPSFGAAPVEMPIQPQVPVQAPMQEPTYSTPEGEFVGPKAPSKEDLDFAKRQSEFQRMQKKFGFNSEGIIQEGKYAGERWYGPETKAWVRGYGIENIRKKPELMQELEWRAKNEARRYSGLEEIPMPTQQNNSVIPQTPEEKQEFLRHVTYTGMLPNGQKAAPELVVQGTAQEFPDHSKRAMEREAMTQKENQRKQAEYQALQNTIRYAKPMLQSIEEAKKILTEKGNLASGVWANKLMPSWNQAYQDLHGNFESIGGSLLADSVKALRETSPNGTLGIRLTEKEIMKEIQRMGPQAMSVSPEMNLKTLDRLEKMTRDTLNYANERLATYKNYKPAGNTETQKQEQSAMPAQSTAAPAAPKRYRYNPQTGNLEPIGG